MRLLAVLTVVTALTVTGCASPHPAGTSGSGSDRTSASASASVTRATGAGGSRSAVPSAPVDARCPAKLDEGQYNGSQAQPAPSSIEVDWVLRCRVVPQPDNTRFLLVERSDSNPSALLAALRASDEPPSSSQVCVTMRVALPYFALVQPGGEALAPKVPLTGCRAPQAALVRALNGLRFQVISRTQLP